MGKHLTVRVNKTNFVCGFKNTDYRERTGDFKTIPAGSYHFQNVEIEVFAIKISKLID